MDFKSLIQKIESIDGAIETPKAPTLPSSVQLNEDAQLRVLSGQSTILAEAKKKADDDMKAEKESKSSKKEKKTDESVDSSEEALNEYESKNGRYVHKGTRGTSYDAGSDDEPEADSNDSKAGKTAAEREVDRAADEKEAKKGKDWEAKHGKGSVTRVKGGKKVEGVDPEIFKSKFARMVEAAKKGKKPDFLDVDKDGDKKEPMKKAVADKKKGAVKEETSSTGGNIERTKTGLKHTSGNRYKGSEYDPSQERSGHRKDLDDLTHPEDSKRANKHKKAAKIKESRMVAESADPRMSFRDMIKLVVESGGQQQIDPLDKELFAWASRVARTKLGEGMKSEIYAGMTYERMGGTFRMYDVLSEDHE